MRIPHGTPLVHSRSSEGEGPEEGAAVFRLDPDGWATEANGAAASSGSRRILLPGDRLAAINGAGPSDPQYMELTARVTDAGDAEYRLDFERATSLNATRAARPLREVLVYMEDQIHGLNEGRQWGDEWTRFTSLEAPERR